MNTTDSWLLLQPTTNDGRNKLSSRHGICRCCSCCCQSTPNTGKHNQHEFFYWFMIVTSLCTSRLRLYSIGLDLILDSFDGHRRRSISITSHRDRNQWVLGGKGKPCNSTIVAEPVFARMSDRTHT